MIKELFLPGDILLPEGVDMGLWSAPACDQYTAEPEYWDALEAQSAGLPSALWLMLPEAYLGIRDTSAQTDKALKAMEDYLSGGVFRELKDSYIYIERLLPGGALRRGLLGLVDLEGYDYSPASVSPVRATEATVESRLPPRTAVRQRANLEMPHILMLADDIGDVVLNTAALSAGELLYDFDLRGGYGHIRGRRIAGEAALAVKAALDALGSDAALTEKFGSVPQSPIILAMGDGNHSLAAAKQWYESLKASLGPAALSHPARYALAELVNVRDAAVDFQPIHRLIAGTDTAGFLESASRFWRAQGGTAGERTVALLSSRGEIKLPVGGLSLGKLVSAADEFCSAYIAEHGGSPDYIHGDASLRRLAVREGCCGILLPPVDKGEFFKSVMVGGPLPKKSFSIGGAADKRCYLECRRIK